MPGGNRRGQETRALNYVLSLSSGSNEKILDNITGEGRQLMATAESVFQKAAEELEDGTIVIGQLELILEHKRQFVDIWNLSKYEAEQRPEGRNLGMAFCGQGVFLGIVTAGSSCQHIEKLWFISEECHEQAVE